MRSKDAEGRWGMVCIDDKGVLYGKGRLGDSMYRWRLIIACIGERWGQYSRYWKGGGLHDWQRLSKACL
jgi:hypothetical protein